MDDSILSWLQQWFLRYCYDEFFHEYRIKIDTLGNPGWRVSIDLTGTEFELAEFALVEIERSEHDWLHCFVRDNRFEGRCGPLNLSEVLVVFRDWVDHVDSLNK